MFAYSYKIEQIMKTERKKEGGSIMIKIEKGHPDFKAFKFVLRAKSSDSIKSLFTCLFSDGENAVCTDANRLHTIKLERELLAGLYDVITSNTKEIVLNESTVDGQYPNYKQVMYKEKVNSQPLNEWNKRIHGASTLFDIMSKGICINPEYVKHACEDCGELKVIIPDPEKVIIPELATSPVQITNNFGIAVIMPIQAKVAE